MTSALESLQSAIFFSLKNDATLIGLIGADAIFETVPDKADMPFLTLAQHDVFARDTGDSLGHRHVVALHAWSRLGGRKQVAQILEAARDVLENATLSLVDHHLILLNFDRLETRQNVRDRIWKGALRMTVLSEPTN